jgi:hypothetical protein
MCAFVSLIRWLNQWPLKPYVGTVGNVLNGAIVFRSSDVRIALNRLPDAIALVILIGVGYVPINGADVLLHIMSWSVSHRFIWVLLTMIAFQPAIAAGRKWRGTSVLSYAMG